MKKILMLILCFVLLGACTRDSSDADVQSGGNVTGVLQTGDWYTLERFEGGVWKAVTCKPQEREVAWHSIAYGIEREGETSLEEDWEGLYGELAKGKYRIGKQVNDFRDTGNYDSAVVYGEFEIKESAE